MTTITALPTPPTRSDPSTFAARADAFVDALPDFVTEANAVASEVNANATAAAASALQAAADGTAVWVSGTTYAVGDVRYSPANYQTYRRTTAGAGTTDPSADSTNWARLYGEAAWIAIDHTDSPYTATGGQRLSVNASGGAVTINLPAGTLGDDVVVKDAGATFGDNTVTVAPNGSDTIESATSWILDLAGECRTFSKLTATNWGAA